MFRTLYGVLLTGTLCLALPQARRFFLSEKWGGYTQSDAFTDKFQSPPVLFLILCGWFFSALCLVAGRWTLPAALFNLAASHYFFIQLRWKSILRGMGAPGFMTYWLGAVVFFFEYARAFAPQLGPLALTAARLDFALIMLSSGIYKALSGYPQNNGMEFGLVNPQWAYAWKFFRKFPASHFWFKFQDQCAWSLQILAGILMLIPQTKLSGALIIMGSFFLVRTQIRLGLLGEMVMLGGALFFSGFTWPEKAQFAWPAMGPVTALFTVFLTAYLFLLPFVYSGLGVNLYFKKPLWKPLQKSLEKYANAFGIILWRVFSVDLINFYIMIYSKKRGAAGERILISKYGWKHSFRFSHVGESITITSLFTTLKYYSGNKELFYKKILRYARTLDCPPDSTLIFEYVYISKKQNEFCFTTAAEYEVDIPNDSVAERYFEDGRHVAGKDSFSPLHVGQTPGSYVPRA